MRRQAACTTAGSAEKKPAAWARNNVSGTVTAAQPATAAVSAALNSCCSMLLAAMGRAKRINFPVNGPWSMSTEDAVCMEIPP